MHHLIWEQLACTNTHRKYSQQHKNIFVMQDTCDELKEILDLFCSTGSTGAEERVTSNQYNLTELLTFPNDCYLS